MKGIQLTPQDTVERGLALAAAAGADGCVVLVAETSSTNLRWANNTLTTNGAMRGSSVTVIATVGAGEGTAAGIIGRSSVTDDTLREWFLDFQQCGWLPHADESRCVVLACARLQRVYAKVSSFALSYMMRCWSAAEKLATLARKSLGSG